MRLRLLFGIIFGIIFLAVKCWGAPSPSSAPSDEHEHFAFSAPYCGLYSVYSVLRYYRSPVALDSLLNPKYLGSSQGSTFPELVAAAKDNGLFAEPIANMSLSMLRDSPYPIVLHVKADPYLKEYDHFAVCFRGEKDAARIFDPSQGMLSVPYWRVARIWDGNGIVLSKSPIDDRRLLGTAQLQFLGAVFFFGIGILGIRHFFPATLGCKGIMAGLRQASLLTIAVLVASVAYNGLADAGLLQGPLNSLEREAAHSGPETKYITLREFSDLNAAHAVVIDARQARDFAQGHVNGAMNIPPGSTRIERMEILRDVDNQHPIVCYCQSVACVYSEVLAIQLASDGFSNVTVFSPGWEELRKHQSKMEPSVPRRENH
jgi:rhodanese-related sulfurtransferase